jgi:hypothetical protein
MLQWLVAASFCPASCELSISLLIQRGIGLPSGQLQIDKPFMQGDRLVSPKSWAPRLAHGIFRRCRFLQPSRHVETEAKWLPDQAVYVVSRPRFGCYSQAHMFV